MQVFRFMSNEEFDKFNRGDRLLNYAKHCDKNKTTSVGFCFLNLEDFEPEYAMHFLYGLVHLDVCAVFEVDDELLDQTIGAYAKPFQSTGDPLADLLIAINGLNERFVAKEYCTTENFNDSNFKLIKYSKDCHKTWDPEGKNKFEWREI